MTCRGTGAGQTAGIARPAGAGLHRSDIDAVLNTSFRRHVAASAPAAVGPPPIRGLIDVAWVAPPELRHGPLASFPLE
jgi:hypothetical protein